MRPHWIRMDSKSSMTDGLLKRREQWSQRHPGRKTMWPQRQTQGGGPGSLGMPATTRSWKGARAHSPLELSEGSEPGPKLNFELLDSGTVREKRNTVVLFTQFVIICCSSTKKRIQTWNIYLFRSVISFIRVLWIFSYRSCTYLLDLYLSI